MTGKTIGRALMGLGVTVGIASIVIAKLEIAINFPDWMVRVAMIKLAIVAAGGLLAAGAFVGRHAKGRELTDRPVAELGEGDALPSFTNRRDASPVDVPRESRTPH